MKKRLLSAALALAMVLTMLPLSVFAAAATPTTESVTWYAPKTEFKDAAGSTTSSGDDGGWFTRKQDTTDTTKYNYDKKTTGVLNSSAPSGSATWTESVANALTLNWSTIRLLANVSDKISLSRNVTIDVAGKTLGAIEIPAKIKNTSGNDVDNPCTSLTIKDSTVSTGGTKTNIGSSAISVGASGEAKANNTTITLENVETSGAIEANYKSNCTVTLNNAKTGNITLTGESGGAVNVGTTSLKGEAGAVSITTTGTATGGKVTAYNATITSVALTGVGANLTATNSNVGVVTLLGHDGTGLTDTQKSTLNTPSVILYGGTATSIAVVSGEADALSKPYTVTLNSDATIGDTGISLVNANVTVNNSSAGAITVENGDVKITGSATAPASAKVITLGKTNTSNETSLTVSGSKVSTGNIVASGGTVKVTVPNDETNTFGAFPAAAGAVSNRGVSGGVWGGPVPADNLSTTLVYQVKRYGGKYVYYAGNQFQKLIDEYQGAADGEKPTISLVKDTEIKDTGNKTITFKNGSEILTVISYMKSSLPITLPTSVNGGAVSKWTEYEDSSGKEGNVIRDLVSTAGYSTPATPEDRILNAQVTDNAITKLTGASSSVPGLTVRLVGNVITLSGAIPKGTSEIEIEVTTDGKPPVEETVKIVYDESGKVRFANQSLSDGLWVTNDWAYLVMPNDTTRYSLNGSGLKMQADNLNGKVHGYTEKTMPVIVTVNCSGNQWTTVRKKELANSMSNDVKTFGGAFALEANDGSSVDFSASPAVKEALNAVVANISESQVSSWILNAQNTSWRKKNNTTPNAADRAKTGYSEVHVVAYMAVNITNYNTASTPGTMTMTLTPSYYVEVTGPSGAKVDTEYALDPTVSAQLNALRPRSGSLGSLTGEAGKITLTLKTETAFNTNGAVAHQNNTYAYEKDKTEFKFEITHTVNNGLGTFVINGDSPMVTLYDKKDGGAVKGTYNTLQAAVDDAKDTWYINVDANYKGSCQVNMTGEARKITVNTNGANRVTSNASGTVVTETASGTVFELQLTTSTSAATTSVTVGTATGGSARTNATSTTKPGDTVTITATASAGYQASAPTVRDNTSNSTVATTAGSNGTWTFVVPAGCTSITVTPRFVLSTGLPYTDVTDTSVWYFQGVKYCYDTQVNGSSLMQGDTSNQFAPNSQLTRAQMVQILWNLAGRPSVTGSCPFPDVVGTGYDWAKDPITWAAQKGYVIGYTDGKFHPEVNVSRQDMVTILYRYANKPTIGASGSLSGYYDGSKVGSWATDAVRWATSMGILSGTNSVALNGYINGPAKAKRCEVAVTIANFYKMYG